MPLFTEPHLLNASRWANMRIGLLGGSFNPPHIGHLHISKVALNTLNLDAIWWLVTPQNPLKSSKELLPIKDRIHLSREIIDHPKIIVTDIEDDFDTTYSYTTIKNIKRYFPKTHFCFITGMDNAHSMHNWQKWREMLSEVCMVHITRAPPVKLIKNCPVRMLSTQKNIILKRGGKVFLDSHTTYWLLQKKMINISSTQLRKELNKIK